MKPETPSAQGPALQVPPAKGFFNSSEPWKHDRYFAIPSAMSAAMGTRNISC